VVSLVVEAWPQPGSQTAFAAYSSPVVALEMPVQGSLAN